MSLTYMAGNNARFISFHEAFCVRPSTCAVQAASPRRNETGRATRKIRNSWQYQSANRNDRRFFESLPRHESIRLIALAAFRLSLWTIFLGPVPASSGQESCRFKVHSSPQPRFGKPLVVKHRQTFFNITFIANDVLASGKLLYRLNPLFFLVLLISCLQTFEQMLKQNRNSESNFEMQFPNLIKKQQINSIGKISIYLKLCSYPFHLVRFF